MVRAFVSVFLFWNHLPQPREEELASSQELDEVMVYFAKQMQLNRGSIGKQERVGCYRELLLQGQVIVRNIEFHLVQNMSANVSQESLNQESFLKLLLFNNCVCYL